MWALSTHASLPWRQGPWLSRRGRPGKLGPGAKPCPQPAFVVDTLRDVAVPVTPRSTPGCFHSKGAAPETARPPSPKYLPSDPLRSTPPSPISSNHPDAPRTHADVFSFTFGHLLSYRTRKVTRAPKGDFGRRRATPACEEEAGGGGHLVNLAPGAHSLVGPNQEQNVSEGT